MDGCRSLLIRSDSSLALRCRKGAIHPIIRSPRRRGLLVADIPDADYFARCVLDRVITGYVRFAEDVDFAVESLPFVNIHYRFSLRVQDGPKCSALYAARHIGGYADIITARRCDRRIRAARLSL